MVMMVAAMATAVIQLVQACADGGVLVGRLARKVTSASKYKHDWLGRGCGSCGFMRVL